MDRHVDDGLILRILIADGSSDWRAEFGANSRDSGASVVAEATTAGECIEAVKRTHPDIAFVDIDLPGGGLMTTARLVARHPRLQVLMTAEHMEEADLLAALRAGAKGVILKPGGLGGLHSTLHSIMAGQVVIPRHLVRVLVEEFTRLGRARRAVDIPGSQRLSAREHQAVSLLLDGCSTEEIAQAMYVSPGSVRAYLSRALAKLRVSDRDELRSLVTQMRGRPAADRPPRHRIQ